ncbi:MAG: hypothetical protein K2X48_08925 [Chitinophagaceae bacterium]|nr:hypothetical protein [Chitinophagaceae bacterium]
MNEALNPPALADFENGVRNLTNVIANRDNGTDTFLRHEDFWQYQTIHGYCYEMPTRINKELIGLSIKLFNSFNAIPIYIPNETDFDILYPGDCNGFNGFDFTPTAIPANKQITELISFTQFKQNCATHNAYNSILDFWNSRAALFPNLIFCERVWEQISHLSVNDDRFKLINEKLKRLNAFTRQWTAGVFDFKSLGLENSPDTPTRVANTLALRTFDCPGIGNRVFSLHIKWSYGREFFRLYYFPNETNHRVYIGYIGPKDDIGF